MARIVCALVHVHFICIVIRVVEQRNHAAIQVSLPVWIMTALTHTGAVADYFLWHGCGRSSGHSASASAKSRPAATATHRSAGRTTASSGRIECSEGVAGCHIHMHQI